MAGPALASWLSRYGLEVTVVERAPGIRPGGYAVDFRGSATCVLERMGLVEAVKKHETRTGSITIVNANNQVVVGLPRWIHQRRVRNLARGFGHAALWATRSSAEYLFNDSIQSITQVRDGVEVAFASGTVRSFDIVVGADGLHSIVRAIAFGDESQFVRPMGYHIAIFTLPDFLGLGNTGRYCVELGKRAGCFGTPNDGGAKAYFYFATERLDYDRRDVPAQKQLLRETFAGVKSETQRMLEMLDASPDFYFDSLSQVKMDSWSNRRVVLLGDAAACASPMAGMGTSFAIVGAYVLAGELLASAGNYAAAFAEYEASMRSFVSAAQKMAEGLSWLIPETRLKLWFSKKLWSWMPQSTLRKLMIEQPIQIANMVQLKEYS